METNEVVLVSAARTAIGKFMGSLKDVPARDLAMTAGQAAIERSGVPADQIDEICMGQLYTGMQGSLPANQVGKRLGLPDRAGAVSVNQNCSSGMRAAEIAAQNIMLGKTDIGLVVGVESMTNAPYMIPNARMGYRMGPGQIEDSMLHDGLVDELVPGHMGLTAENVAERYQITRQECDELALLSHTRAKESIDGGYFKKEIVPVPLKSKRGPQTFENDEHLIRDCSIESLQALRPAFKKDGAVTAGNASGINDGASAAVLMSKKKADELGIKPLMKLVSVCTEGCPAVVMGIGPAYSIPKALKQAGLTWDDIQYWEINEAFAAQWLGVGRVLKNEHNIDIDMDKVNHHGSGIALGHPVGSTGLRILVTLYHEMERMDYEFGGASLCVRGGPSMASLWTRNI